MIFTIPILDFMGLILLSPIVISPLIIAGIWNNQLKKASFKQNVFLIYVAFSFIGGMFIQLKLSGTLNPGYGHDVHSKVYAIVFGTEMGVGTVANFLILYLKGKRNKAIL